MALRGGVAVGGARQVLPAAAGAAGGGRAADGVADPGAVRPARGPRGGGAVHAVRVRHPRYTHAEDARGLRAGATRPWRARWSAPGGTTRGRWRVSSAAAGTCSARSPPTRSGPPPRPTRCCHCSPREAGLRTQVQSGVESHRARFGVGWRGGFWLPECAHAAHLEPRLAEAGVHATCVELTGRLGLGAPAHLRPLRGRRAWCSSRSTAPRWRWCGARRGYPAHGHYRDYHRHTVHHHQPWANDGGAYDHARALALARAHAADFVARTGERLRRDGPACPGAAWRCAPWTRSCSVTGGTRASRG